MDDNKVSYCGVKGSFQRIRTSDGTYEDALYIDEVKNLEALYEGAIKLLCVAVDAYVVNYISGWSELEYGPPYNCMNHYLKRHGLRRVFSIQTKSPDAELEIHTVEPLERNYADYDPVLEDDSVSMEDFLAGAVRVTEPANPVSIWNTETNETTPAYVTDNDRRTCYNRY
jgi:hypothetical protein